jgi:hypothetical protein
MAAAERSKLVYFIVAALGITALVFRRRIGRWARGGPETMND